MTLSRTDRTTWPEVLKRRDLATIWGCSAKTIDERRKRGDVPRPMSAPGSDPEWSKADVCDWLDHPRARKGLRLAS